MNKMTGTTDGEILPAPLVSETTDVIIAVPGEAITIGDGAQVARAQGDPVFAGDILETGADGGVGIVFADESTFSLAEDGRMTLDEMIHDPGGQEGATRVSLLQGAFTFVSGRIAKTDVDASNAEDGLAALALFDDDDDGRISSSDEIFGDLRIWRDADTDGVTDEGELLSMTEAGISSTSLQGQAINQEVNGNTVLRSGAYSSEQGQIMEFASVSLDMPSDTETGQPDINEVPVA